jgi:signal transduction histidine kinase
MRKLLWWHVAVVGTVLVLSVLMIIEGAPSGRYLGAIASMAFLLVGWFVFGRVAEDDRRAAIGLLTVVIIACGVGVAFFPALAILQTIAFPALWFFSGGLRTALVANVLLVVAVTVGFLFYGGLAVGNIEQTAITESVSLGLDLALGLWFSSIYNGINERQALIDKLEAAQEQLASLSRDAGAASERERLAREIHDTIAQDLTGLVLTAQRGLRELDAGDIVAARRQLNVLEENARNALTETRALVASGAAIGVDGGGLAIALRRLAERFERETGIAVSVEADDTAALDRDREVVLLRCAQEALANVRKHSSADAASLILAVRDNEVSLSISDDGTGFDPQTPSSGFGLVGLRKRLTLVRGKLDVTASPGGGTTLVATLPGAAESGAAGTTA